MKASELKAVLEGEVPLRLAYRVTEVRQLRGAHNHMLEVHFKVGIEGDAASFDDPEGPVGSFGIRPELASQSSPASIRESIRDVVETEFLILHGK